MCILSPELGLKGKGVERDVPALRQLKTRPTIEEIISKVNASIINDEKCVRQMSIYLCHRYSGLKLRDLGEYFNIGESAISEASRRFSKKLEKDASLREIVEKLTTQLNV